MLGLVLVHFMDGNSGMDNRWLDGLFLDNGLDRLMHVSKTSQWIKDVH